MAPAIYDKVAALTAAGETFAVATVIRVRGSASAKPGAKAVIDTRGRNICGWVGGGCAESYVGSQAVEAIAEARPRIVEVNLDDEIFGLGMPCGGFMDVYIEPQLPKPTLTVATNDVTLGATRHLVETLGYVFAPDTRRHLTATDLSSVVRLVFGALVEARGASGRPLREQKGIMPSMPDDPAPITPPTELLILGSSRISQELARLGVLLKWPVRLYAPRIETADYPEAVELLPVEAGYRNLQIKPGAAVVVASHHKGDPEFIRAALTAGAGYVGLIASKKRSELVFQDLIDNGFEARRLRSVHAPAGLDCGCVTPQDIALSVIAEILGTHAAPPPKPQ